MMELGSGVAVAGLCVSGGAVAITAIRTFATKTIVGGTDGINGKDGRNGTDASFPCVAHSGLVACLEGIEKNQDRQEEWMKEISTDVKELLRK